MLYVAVAVGLAVLIGVHELVVWAARRAIRRPWAVLFGPIVGYVLLVGCAFALYGTYGFSGERRYVVDEVLPGSDAAGKLSAGDRILEVDRVAVSPTDTSLAARVAAAEGKPVTLTIERAGDRRDVTVQPKPSPAGEPVAWLLGFKTSTRADLVHDTTAAMTAAWSFPVGPTRELANRIRALIAGSDQPEAGGPVRIIEVFSDAQRPFGQLALEALLLTGFYVWLALSLLDLVRLIRLARPADARSNVR